MKTDEEILAKIKEIREQVGDYSRAHRDIMEKAWPLLRQGAEALLEMRRLADLKPDEDFSWVRKIDHIDFSGWSGQWVTPGDVKRILLLLSYGDPEHPDTAWAIDRLRDGKFKSYWSD